MFTGIVTDVGSVRALTRDGRGGARLAVQCRYEALVEDFETEARQHAAFLGLDWSGAMADFAKTARTRPVNTPSSTQVTRGLFREGMGQWKAYADQLTPVAPRLAPWVERFGYEA